MEQIKAGLLIPGRGEPVRDATVLIDGGRISYAGPAAARAGRAGRGYPHRGDRAAGAVGLPRPLHRAAGSSTWRGCRRSPRRCAPPGRPGT